MIVSIIRRRWALAECNIYSHKHACHFNHCCGGLSVQMNCVIGDYRVVLRCWASARRTRITLEAGGEYDIMLLILALGLLLVAEITELSCLRFECLV